jgi:hypothetical protein
MFLAGAVDLTSTTAPAAAASRGSITRRPTRRLPVETSGSGLHHGEYDGPERVE